MCEKSPRIIPFPKVGDPMDVLRDAVFISPSRGPLPFESVFTDILAFAAQHPEDQYHLMVGTDSQVRDDATEHVTALIVYRQGKGGRYYFERDRQFKQRSLRQRIFYEASRSLSVASQLTELLADGGHELDVEIHLDVGNNGATRELIKEVVGMIVGSGFPAKIKPDSYAASSVADRYTK